MKIKRAMYEANANHDDAKVVNYYHQKGVAGGGYTGLLIMGTFPDGEHELLELRFKSNFLTHINSLKDALENLVKEEETRKELTIDYAQSICDGEDEEFRKQLPELFEEPETEPEE